MMDARWQKRLTENVGLGLANSWSRVIQAFQLQPACPSN